MSNLHRKKVYFLGGKYNGYGRMGEKRNIRKD